MPAPLPAASLAHLLRHLRQPRLRRLQRRVTGAQLLLAGRQLLLQCSLARLSCRARRFGGRMIAAL
ncbi:hypothetical protein, partial [Paracoccus hibiscisoli]|uniref:hypothetical protein n=1 Tax=Paracoccus hibiscisoli TaxID=2023261 RepID=UPI003918CBC5